MEKEEPSQAPVQSESEDELDDLEEKEEKPIEKPAQLKTKKPESRSIDVQKINELRKKFRDKEYLVKGKLTHQKNQKIV